MQLPNKLILRVAQAYFDVLRAADNLEFVRAEKAAVGASLSKPSSVLKWA